MTTFTNMAWPEDPYGTGQLWRKEPPLLASFAAVCTDDGERALPVAYAVVYLRLHRTQPVDATNGIAFGFRAVSALTDGSTPELVRLFDLDAMRARRLAKIVTGHRLTDELFAIEAMADDVTGRGIRALADAWDSDSRDKNMAAILDTATLSDAGDLADAATKANIDTETRQRAFLPQRQVDLLFEASGGLNSPGVPSPLATPMTICAEEWLAACCTERALLSALVAGQHTGRYVWDEAVNVGVVLAANAGDCFITQNFTSSALAG